MKKKCLSLILGIMLVLSLGSCGKESVNTSGSAEQEMVKDDTTSSTPKAKREDSASKLAENDSNEGNHAEVKIVMIGDILLHEPVMAAFLQEDGSYDFTALFDDTRALSQNSDLAILNQETILGGSELGVSGYPAFNSPQEVGDAEVDAGYNTILSATNHALDRGEGAIRKDISYWKEKHPDVTLLGLHEDEADAEKIRVVEKNGIRIAILNYTYGTNGIAEPEDYLVDDLTEEKAMRELDRAEENADFTIVCPHWGREYQLEESEYQRKYAKLFTEHGADLILGAHPHVIQPIEWVESENGNRCLCYYSVGNFVTGTSDSGAGIMNRVISGMAEVTLHKDEDQVCIEHADIHPLVCHWENGSYRVIPLEHYSEELAEKNEIKYRDPSFSLDSVKLTVDSVWPNQEFKGE